MNFIVGFGDIEFVTMRLLYELFIVIIAILQAENEEQPHTVRSLKRL